MADIFRKKSLDNIATPDHLDDYINVSNPSVWIILAAIIVFLLGVFIWCFFGKLDGVTPYELLFN
jgi:hypothetical protein